MKKRYELRHTVHEPTHTTEEKKILFLLVRVAFDTPIYSLLFLLAFFSVDFAFSAQTTETLCYDFIYGFLSDDRTTTTTTAT